MQTSGTYESVSAEHHHKCRPRCRCCGGGDYRKGYASKKAVSMMQSAKGRTKRKKWSREK